MPISGQSHGGAAAPEVESATCASCGFTEDCTPAYILRVRDRHRGRWLCGLCAEAVKVEALRSGAAEDALDRHIALCREFRSGGRSAAVDHPISAMGRRLRRSLDANPRPLRSNSSAELRSAAVDEEIRRSSLARSGSCVS